MTGTEAPALSGRLAFVPTEGETLASRRSIVAISGSPPVLPVVRDSLRFRSATSFAVRVIWPGGPGPGASAGSVAAATASTGQPRPGSALRDRLAKAPLVGQAGA